MIAWQMLFVPGLMAIVNRYWRGEGTIDRLTWYVSNAMLALALSLDAKFSLIWLLFELGYAMMPWQAMFSAVHGVRPGRKDGWLTQWMQPAAHWTAGKLYGMDYESKAFWQRFGIVYGAFRGALMLPAIYAMALYTQSPVPWIGLVFLFMGQIYYWGGKIAHHFGCDNVAVALSEVVMGWLCGTYLLICLSQL